MTMEFPKQVAVVSMAKATNAAHYEYMAQVKRRVESRGLGAGRWQEAMAWFAEAVEAEDQAFKLYQASLKTPSLKEADERRDATYQSFKAAVEAFASFPLEQMAGWGQRLLRVLKNYKLNVDASYMKESALLYNMLQDLDGDEESEAIDGLQLRELVDRLREANDEVRQMIDDRSEDRSSQVRGLLKSARETTDRAYALLVLSTNAVATLEPDDEDAQWLVRVMQEDIDYFRRYNMNTSQAGSNGGTDTPGADPTPSTPSDDDPVSTDDGQGTEGIAGDPGLL